MHLTWRDGITTTMAAAVAAVYVGFASNAAIPVIDDARGAAFVIGAIGLAMCISGASLANFATKEPVVMLASVLGGAATVLAILGLITGWAIVVALLAADTLLLWAIATLRHALGGVRSQATT